MTCAWLSWEEEADHMTPEAFRERVRALLPAIRERAADAERLRRLPDETFNDFQAAGLFRCLQPGRYGGYELHPKTFYEATLDLSAICGSTGWVFGVLGVHNWQLALFPPQAQEEVWGEDTSVQLSSSYAPTGSIERVDGGFRVRGRWSFSSGCDHCQWALLGGIVPRQHDDEPTDMRTFLLPRQDYDIDDNWYVAGLSGSGSKDIVVEDAFVPAHRTHAFRDARDGTSPGLTHNPAPLYRIPFVCVFSHAVSAPAIGVALGALRTFREQAAARVTKLDNRKVAEDPFTHYRLAEASTLIDGVRTRLLQSFDEFMAAAQDGRDIPLARRARCRWEAASAVQTSVQAVDRLFEASGGRAIFLSNPLQRAFRDVHAMRAHGANNPERAASVLGQFEFGLPSRELFI
jgi:3-hydroxy-9,10-secoandrosta-1,3,5(10)-triene-9,17-dione monooxygenase